ncbi:LysR family transcriptional regulator [Saccharopolyspora griseoalba]|uniref:LysR family transcriptional regulator n=1 Tax=Saccharopolyspora griseoalba TaxID=1431848 RepID=A0ABW2LNQ5_9PSEU
MVAIENSDSLVGVDTDLLRTFLAVARRGSFTAAAADLHLVQSTVTSRIQALERQLGVRLLDRLPDGTRLTTAGDQALLRARALLDAERRLLEDVATTAEPAGEVVVGAPESVCAYRLPRAIAALRHRNPRVRVHLAPAGTRETFRGLLEGRFDIGLVLDEAPVPGPLTPRTIGSEPVVLVAAPDHPALRAEPGWDELAGYPYFLLEEGCSYSDSFLRELERNAASEPQVTRFGSIEAARSCVEAGLGLSVLPRTACARALDDVELRELPGPRRPDAPLVLVLDERRWRSPVVREVIETVTDAAARRSEPGGPS